MITLNFKFPLMSTPRERIARNGGRYKPKEYKIYQARLYREVMNQLTLIDPISYRYYVGFFNGYVSRFDNHDPSDLDNILKGILDTMVLANKLRGDNRSRWIGSKILCSPVKADNNVIYIGMEAEELQIDQQVSNLKLQANLLSLADK